MKTEREVQAKLKECEAIIEDAINVHSTDLVLLAGLKSSRLSLLWMLSDWDIITEDELIKQLDWEITCIESSELF